MKKLKTFIAWICRTLLGAVFIFSGFVKAIDPLGTVYKIEDYLKAFGGFFTDLLPWATTAAIILIALECVLGICMVLNVRTRLTSWIALLFYLVMTPLTLYIAIKNPVSDCGCFGDAIVISNWQTFGKNVVLLTMAILLCAWRKNLRARWSGIVEWGLVLLSLAAAGGMMAYSYTHLPIIDFRPYKIGNHIPTLMENVDPVYEYTYICEKDGVEQTFTTANYPDSTWKLVRYESTVIQEGKEAPIHDLEIVNMYDENITQDILESPDSVTLVIMYDLKKSDMQQMDKVKALYEACMNQGQQCYILTGSETNELITFIEDHSMLSEGVCSCDPVTLKTIVRANPGVIVIKEGTIIDKYNIRNR